MADPKGTIIITGASGGLGSATASHIVSSPQLCAKYHGIYTVRNAAAIHEALDTALVRKEFGSPKVQQDNRAAIHTHERLSLDLTRLSDVRKAASEINARVAGGKIPRIHALILNAGFEEFKEQTWTEDGRDTAFASNYLGHWLLTLLLLQSMSHEVGRIVWISSWSHK